MPDQGYQILHNGVIADLTACEAARYAKSKAKGDMIEIVDCATGSKLIMLEDGRTG